MGIVCGYYLDDREPGFEHVEDEEEAKEYAEENGWDHWSFTDDEENEGSEAWAIAYNIGEDPVFKGCSFYDKMSGEYFLQEVGDEMARHYEKCWVKHWYNDLSLVSIPNWEKRNEGVWTQKEAAQLIASKLSGSFGSIKDDVLAEIQEFANKQGIPFNATIYKSFREYFDYDCPVWNSSSAWC